MSTIHMSHENPLRLALSPRNLVMTMSNCFYCLAPDTGSVNIEYLYGLKHCDEHKEIAKRDCCAHMHRIGYAKMKDCLEHPIVGQFLAALPTTFPIMRSNGMIDEDWRLNFGNFIDEEFIINHENKNTWIVSVCKGEGDKFFRKHILISDFLKPEIIEISEKTKELLHSAVDALSFGIYKEYQDAYQFAVEPGLSTIVEDDSSIHRCILNGKSGRIFIP